MFKNMTKVLTLAVVVAMMLSMTSCAWIEKIFGGNKTPTECTEHVDADGDRVCDNEGCGMALDYTYNTYLSTFPNSWNPHTYQTSTDSEILDYTTLGFYAFDYNETKDGFVIVPELAADMPVDVTSNYVGETWGIEEGEENRVYLIQLRDDLRWEDGTSITANDFVESAKRLLDPKAVNYRADSLYSGNLVISGAKEYFYSGRSVKNSSTMIDSTYTHGYVALEDLTVGANGQLYSGESDLWFNINKGGVWSTKYSLTTYYNAGYLDAVPEVAEAYGALIKTADEEGYIAVTAEVADLLIKCVAALQVKGTPEQYAAALAAVGGDPEYAYLEWEEFLFCGGSYPEFSYENVGIKALSDTELVLILESPLAGFYLNYSLGTDLGLVHIPTYDACASVDTLTGLYTNTYGTSVETYKSFGPYKLTNFEMDKSIVLERNDAWYGYSDSAYAGQYQTTKVVYDCYKNPDTAFTAFLQGKLDGKGLEAKNIADYTASDRIYYTDGASTWFIAMNPNEAAFSEWEADHPGYDKSILTVKEFRMAISFSLNRQDFINALDPMGSIGLALFNSMICSDPENGIMYRTEEAAKDAILEFWGVDQDDIGAGKHYPTKDEAIASITGYNLEGAKELFNQAYDIAVESGIYNGTDTIQICVGLPSQASFYVDGYEFLKNNYTEAVKGTKLEGKLEFVQDATVANNFSDALKGNQVDLLFGVGWTGSALNPYGLIGAYTYPSYQYDPSWDTSTAPMEFTTDDGETYSASVLDWTYAIEGDSILITNVVTGESKEYSCGNADNKPEERVRLLAAIEGAVLRNYDMIPTHNQASASLLGYQVEYGVQEYVYGVGRGGIKYMTYNYTDTEWDAFVSAQGGVLNYK